ncbi:hypothetical protein [Aeribacillus pallidus]|uniref:hypothetical protein n=1 Tax=Aeribacillus pallidus TaxID=33936 RepID=UPI003D1EB180
MPYQGGGRLPAQKASKIGHLDVIKSPLVKKLCENFENPEYKPEVTGVKWLELPDGGKIRDIIFAVDGSLQVLEGKKPPYKSLAFVKTALIKVDQVAVSRLDKNAPNPFALRDLMKKSAQYHATVFPLRHVNVPNKSVYDTVREVLYESLKDESLNGEIMDTLKWLVFEKWDPLNQKSYTEEFGCPHCNKEVAKLPLDKDVGVCSNCRKKIFISDLFGLHFNMNEDFAPSQIASDYMSIHETLMMLTPVRYYWENRREVLNRCLIVKDGPLSLRATLSKLSAPIRRFMKYAKEQGVEIALIGQEKSGAFFDHLQLIGGEAPLHSIFLPDNKYIRNQIQQSNAIGIYGEHTNYGAKVFVKLDKYNSLVLNIPTGEKGECVENPDPEKLIALRDIVATLPSIISNLHEGALLPIVLAHGVSSLSTYPSAKTLEMFSEASIVK